MLNPLSDLSIPIGKEVVWIIFFIVALIVILMAFVFNYHWKYHGLQGKGSLLMKSIYAIGTMILLSGAFLLATMF